MIGRRARRVMAAALLLAAAPAGSDREPGGYRLTLPITVDSGGRVQRVALPAAVLAVLQTHDGHDVRVFDARGRAMPIARGAVSRSTRRDTLAAMPILGASDALKISGVSLRLDGSGAAQVAEVRGEPVATDGAVVLGALFDARRVTGRATRLSVDADLPVGQPVTFLAEASDDLRDWRPLGETTVYRRAGDLARPAIVPLHGATVARDYLRVTWRAGSRLLTPVAIRQAVLETRPDGEDATVTLAARAPAVDDARAIDIALPFATPIASLRVMPAEEDGVIPVRILGRDDREQPWALLGKGLATSDGTRAIAIALSGDTPRIVRIEADARSAGFTRPPALRIGYAQRSVIFLASGVAPFALSAGRYGAGNPFLSPEDMGADRPPAEARLSSSPQSVLTLARPADDSAARRLILWAVLLVATAALAGVAWLLWRQTVRAPGSRP